MQNGDQVIIRAVANAVHEDGTAWVVTALGQSIHIDQRSCEVVELPPMSDEYPESDGLDKLKISDLTEICASEGLTFQIGANKSILIETIRAQRSAKV